MKNTHERPHVICSHQVRRAKRLHLINNSDTANSNLNCDYIAPIITAAWCERYLIETCSVVCPRNYFFPFLG
jgi:hypothetical protein